MYDVGLVAQFLKIQDHLPVLFIHLLDVTIGVVNVELHLLDLLFPVCLFYVRLVTSRLLLTHGPIVQSESVHSRLTESLFGPLLFFCAHEPCCCLSKRSFGVQEVQLQGPLLLFPKAGEDWLCWVYWSHEYLVEVPA